MAPVTDIEVGKRILLGQRLKEFVLPDGTAIPIRRMGMNQEVLFVDLFTEFTDEIKKTKDDVAEKIADYLGGRKQFTLVDGLDAVVGIISQLPRLQGFALQGLEVICKAQEVTLPDDVKDYLSTADCFDILGAQAEAQGLLGTFRKIIAGLGSASN